MRIWGVVALAVFLGAVALDNVGLKGCQQDPWPSSLTWDGEAYAVAWASPDRRKSTILVHRFHERDFKGKTLAVAGLEQRFPERVYRTDSVLAPPEIAFAGDGFMVFVHDGERRLIAVPLDRSGAPSGEPVVVAAKVDMLCVSPVAIDGRYAASYLTDGELIVARLDRAGAVIGRERFVISGPRRCAMAAGDGRFAVIVERGGGGQQVATRRGDALVVEVAGDGGPLRITREPGGWAMMHRDQSRLRVIRFDDSGDRRGDSTLPPAVDPASVDLSRSERGLFVTWIDGRQIRIAFVDPFEELGRLKTGRDALGTRALGNGDRCAATWTTDEGRRVWILQAGGC